MKDLVSIHGLLATLIYSVAGAVVLIVLFWVVDRLMPENLWKEIIEKQNKALAIVAGAFMIALAIIIASAIHE